MLSLVRRVRRLDAHAPGDLRQEVHNGDKILVKVLDVDQNNKIRLSRRAVLRDQRSENSPDAEEQD